MDKDNEFLIALKYALEQGIFKVDYRNFEGWIDSCDCASCKAQRTIADYMLSVTESDECHTQPMTNDTRHCEP